MRRHSTNVKIIAVLFETLMANLHSLNHRWSSMRHDSMQLTSSVGLWDVATMAVSSSYTWCEGVGMSLTYRLKRTGDPPCATPACMPRQDDMAVWKDALNVRSRRYDEIYGLGRTGNLGSLACTGGHRSKRYWRLWPRRGKLHLLASLHQSSWLFFQQGWPTARKC